MLLRVVKLRKLGIQDPLHDQLQHNNVTLQTDINCADMELSQTPNADAQHCVQLLLALRSVFHFRDTIQLSRGVLLNALT